MCISKEASVLAFASCTAACTFLYSRNRPNDRWIAVIFLYIGCMQLLEYLMWTDQKCSGTNQWATEMAFWHNIFQPFITLGTACSFTGGNVHYLIYLSFALYLAAVPQIYNAKKPNQCSHPCENSSIGLAWPYTNGLGKLGWFIFLIAVSSPFLAMRTNGWVYFSITVGTYLLAATIASKRCPNTKNIPSNGSWWCLMAAFIPTAAIFINR